MSSKPDSAGGHARHCRKTIAQTFSLEIFADAWQKGFAVFPSLGDRTRRCPTALTSRKARVQSCQGRGDKLRSPSLASLCHPRLQTRAMRVKHARLAAQVALAYRAVFSYRKQTPVRRQHHGFLPCDFFALARHAVDMAGRDTAVAEVSRCDGAVGGSGVHTHHSHKAGFIAAESRGGREGSGGAPGATVALRPGWSSTGAAGRILMFLPVDEQRVMRSLLIYLVRIASRSSSR
jgi:hypothetical protein